MDINGINPLGRLDKAEQRSDKDVNSTRPVDAKSEPAKDTVEVSSSGDVARHAAEIAKLPEVRTERVEALQADIARGSYEVPAEDIAAKILDELV